MTWEGMVIQGAEGTPGMGRGSGQRTPALRDREVGRDNSRREAPSPRQGQRRILATTQENLGNLTKEGPERLQAYGLLLVGNGRSTEVAARMEAEVQKNHSRSTHLSPGNHLELRGNMLNFLLLLQ